VRVGLILDNPRRDLRGTLLVAHQLLRRGHEVSVIPMYLQGTDVPLLGLDGILVNFVRSKNLELLRAYKAMGLRVFVLDTEGGNLSLDGANAPAQWGRRLREDGVGEVVDHYFLWGRALHEAFCAESGLPASRLHVTGCPRYDVCHPRWQPLIRSSGAPYVLVNTNFPAINPVFNKTRQEESRAYVEAGWDAAYVEAFFSELAALFERYLSVLRELFRDNAQQRFLVRPHPFENEAAYRERLSDLGNVVVDSRGDVFDALGNASCLIHLNCTTAVEACLMGRASISLEFLNTDLLKRHWPLPSTVSHCARDVQEVHDLIRSPERLAGAGASAEVMARIEPWFHTADGEAGARVAALIDRVLREDGPRDRPYSIGRSLRSSRERPRPAQVLQGALGNLLGSRRVGRLRGLQDESRRRKEVPLDTVRTGLREIGQCNGGEGAEVAYARHPWTRQPLATIQVTPRA
jgi:surface carbohydrate biosynthesis protein